VKIQPDLPERKDNEKRENLVYQVIWQVNDQGKNKIKVNLNNTSKIRVYIEN